MESDLEKARRVSRWLEGEEVGPYKIELRPTNQCNLDCISCKARGKRWYNPEKELNKKEIIKAMKEASELGVEIVHISGSTGEPLFEFDKTFSAMKEIKKLGMKGEIVTNGTIMMEGAPKEIVGMEWDKMTFSLDAPDAETHDYLRGRDGAFAKTVTNIKKIQKWKNKLGKNKPELAIAIVVSSKNYDKLEEMLELANDLRADTLLIQTLTIKDKEIGGELLMNDREKEKLKENLKDLRKLSKRLNIPTNIDLLDDYLIEEEEEIEKVVEKDAEGKEGEKSIPCFFPWFFMEINSTGIVEPCGTRPLGGKINLKNRSLKDIWFGEEFNKFRERLKSSNIPKTCTKCCGASIMINRKIRNYLED